MRIALNNTIHTLTFYLSSFAEVHVQRDGRRKTMRSKQKSPRVHMSPSSAPEWRFAGDRDTRVISGLSRLLARGRSLTSPVPRGLRRRLARGDFEWLGQPAMRGFV